MSRIAGKPYLCLNIFETVALKIEKTVQVDHAKF